MRVSSSPEPNSAGIARDHLNVAHSLEALQQATQLRQVLDLDDRRDHRLAVVLDLDVSSTDVDLRLCDHRSYVAEQTRPVHRLDLDGDGIELSSLALPFDIHQSSWIVD